MGGKNAHYAKRVTPDKRMKEYPDQPFQVRQEAAGAVMWCNACGKPVSHSTKTGVDQHIKTKGHATGLEHLKLRDEMKLTKQEKAIKQVGQPIPLTGRQTTIAIPTQANAIRRTAQDDLVLMFLSTGIPVEKMDHPVFRKWLAKATNIHGCIPTLSGDFPRQNVQRLHNDMLDALRTKMQDQDLAILFDEWTDDAGVATIAVVVITAKCQVAIDVIFLEGCGKSAGVEHKEVAGQLANTIGRLAIDTSRISWVICDEGSVMVAAYSNVLSIIWPKSKLLLCMAHKLNHVGRALQKQEDFVPLTDILFAGCHLLSVPKNAARKRRWLKHLQSKGLENTMPPKVGETRWNAWADAAQWWASNIVTWKAFIEDEYKRVPHPDGGPKTLVERQHEMLTKRLVSTTISVCFVADHTAPIMTAINESQKDGVVGPCLYDIIMNTLVYYEELEKTQKYSPRIEELISKLKNPQGNRDTLHRAAQTLRQALHACVEDRKFTMDLLKELRALHPNNINLISHSQSDYPILFASRPEIAFEWATYCRMPPSNLPKGGEALEAWWDSQPESMFKQLASFLIRIPCSSGSVERFFSLAKLQNDQLTMGEGMRRLAYLCRYNGDICNRLL